MSFERAVKQQTDQYIQMVATGINVNEVGFHFLPLYEQLVELARVTNEIVSDCNMQIKVNNTYMVTLKMLEEIDVLTFMMTDIMREVCEFRCEFNFNEELHND